jgi:serine phosphatase RsbU (regulator of sigma subunit)
MSEATPAQVQSQPARQGAVESVSPLSRRRVVWLARLVWVLIAFLSLYFFISTASARISMLMRLALVHEPSIERLGFTTSFVQGYLVTLDALTFASFSLVGLVLFIRRFSDVYGISASVLMITLAAVLTRPIEVLVSGSYVQALAMNTLITLTTSAIILYLYSFPDGRFYPAWVRWAARGWILWTIFWHFSPTLFDPSNLVVRAMPLPAFLGWIVGGIVAGIYRYRVVFSATQRQQTKWVLFGTIVAGSGYLLHIYLIPLFIPMVTVPSTERLIYETLGVLMLDATMMVFPLSITFSILRYRLWDIDLIIRRTLVYTLVTALLTGVYIALIVGLQQMIFRPMGRPPVIAVAISTLAVSSLFSPLRRTAQAFVDRRFFRDRVDQANLLTTLADSMRRSVDLDEIVTTLLSQIQQALHPATVDIWLYPLEGEDGISGVSSEYCGLVEPPFIEGLRQAQQPVELEQLPAGTESYRQLQEKGAALVVPLISQGEVIGAIYLGRRLSEQGYSLEDRRLLAAVGGQVSPAVRAAQLAQQQRIAALERQRTETELRLGRDVQRTLLAQELPAMPGWQTYNHYQPARTLGGDFYDVFDLPDGRIGVVIGDVSDKGVPASLVMASTRTLVRTLARRYAEPGQVLREVNAIMCGDIPRGMYVTCLYGVLDLISGRFDFANAGHNLPYLYDGRQVQDLKARGMPLGLLEAMEYEEASLMIPKGAWVLFYSDGLVEAHNAAREIFGSSRLKQVIASSPAAEAQIERLLASLAEFTGPDHEQEDDITLLVLQRLEI